MTIAELFRTTLRSGPDYGLVLYHVHVMRPEPDAVGDLVEAGWTVMDSPSTVVDADCVATFVTADESVAFATIPAVDWATTWIFDVSPVNWRRRPTDPHNYCQTLSDNTLRRPK